MQELIAGLVSLFLIQPMQAEIAERLAAAGAPQAVVAEVTSCARTAAPVFVERAAGDPWWAASTALGLWMGSVQPGAVLVEVAPGCRPAVQAARPFLTGPES